MKPANFFKQKRLPEKNCLKPEEALAKGVMSLYNRFLFGEPLWQAEERFTVVAVAQLVESWIVIPVVVGSSPIGHPIK
jgi:hypothetical protein